MGQHSPKEDPDRRSDKHYTGRHRRDAVTIERHPDGVSIRTEARPPRVDEGPGAER